MHGLSLGPQVLGVSLQAVLLEVELDVLLTYAIDVPIIMHTKALDGSLLVVVAMKVDYLRSYSGRS